MALNMGYMTFPTDMRMMLGRGIGIFRRSQPWFAEHYFLGDALELALIGLTRPVLADRVDNEDMRDHLLQHLHAQAA